MKNMFTEQIEIVETDKHKNPSFFLRKFAWKPVYCFGDETKTTVFRIWLKPYWAKMTIWSYPPELEDNFSEILELLQLK